MNANILLTTTAIFLTAFISPTKMQRVDFRARVLSDVTRIEKNSPAFAALEDARGDFLHEGSAVRLASASEKLILVSINKAQPLITVAQDTRELKKITIVQPEKMDHLAKLIASTLEEPEPPTAIELAEILVKEELAKQNRENTHSTDVRKIATASGSSIVVSRPVQINASRFLRSAQNKTRQIETATTYIPNDNKAITNRTTPTRYLLSGPITFFGGAAFLGRRDTITAQQKVDGLPTVYGIVNIRDASFEIAVSDLEGELIAEARSPDGQLMGNGRVNLSELAQTANNQARIKNIALEIRPVFNGVSGSTVSAASYGKNKFIISDAKVYVDGLSREVGRAAAAGEFSDESLSIPSTYVVRGVHEKFWPTISFAESGEKFQLRLFPRSLVEALLNLSLDKYEAREAINHSVIWGRVSMGGSPIEGAKVFVVGAVSKLAHYFNGFIPDKTKTATTESGEFAFTQIKESMALLRVSLNDKLFLPTIIPTEARSVSYAELEIVPGRSVEVKSYDAFTLAPVAAALQPMGTTEELFIPEGGVERFKLDTIKGLTLLESDPGAPYAVSRVTLRSEQSEVHFEQIKQSWLDEISLSINKNNELKNPEQSMRPVIGFVNGDSYQLVIGDGSGLQSRNIVYFDESGRVVQNHGVSGGGFVVFGLPPGLQTLTIIPDRSKKVVSHVVYVDQFASQQSQINLMF